MIRMQIHTHATATLDEIYSQRSEPNIVASRVPKKKTTPREKKRIKEEV
jgi:hypothetical protein